MSARFDFDTPIDRENTDCEKWDGRKKKFGRSDVIPLWVADMDFATAPAVLEALRARALHPVFGYTFASESLLESLLHWYEARQHWRIDPARLQLAPGVVPSLSACVQALTQKSDGILVPTPVYPPFLDLVKKNDRRLVTSELTCDGKRWTFDFDDLHVKARDTKLLLLCHPHNPVGREWTHEELHRLIELALRHNLVIVSDEIHGDLVYPGVTHTPLATLAPPELRLVTALSPSKAFNIPGLNLSAVIAAQSDDQEAIRRVLARGYVNALNPFTLSAFEAAYRFGAEWLDALRDYLAGNLELALHFLRQEPQIECLPPEATCLLWLDCRGMNRDDTSLRHFFVQQAGLGLNDGPSFGPGGTGFMRLNIGTQRARLAKAMEQLAAQRKNL